MKTSRKVKSNAKISLKFYSEFHINDAIKLIDEYVVLSVRINFYFEIFSFEQI
jgi:hypothetical protein